MKRIVSGLLYDTAKAEVVSKFEPLCDSTSYKWWSETLYRTKKGNYFLYGRGMPLSKYPAKEVIKPLTSNEAFEWLAEHDPDKAIELFPEKHIEEA